MAVGVIKPVVQHGLRGSHPHTPAPLRQPTTSALVVQLDLQRYCLNISGPC